MNFFFEVPNAETAPEASTADAASLSPVPPVLQLPPPRFASVHQPYANNQCSACHNTAERMTVAEDTETTCGECHDDYYSDRVGHGPVAAGECMSCHDPHHSTQRALLVKPVFDMCVECHDEPEDLSQPAHAGEVSDCTRCHDAHFGESPLLKPGIPRPAAKNESGD
jgi:predicted CXXCH cytochrome family protein